MQTQRPLRIGIEAQRLFRPHKHGMDIVALELIRQLQQLDHTNEYYIFVKPDEDNQVLRETANCKIIPLAGGAYPFWEQVALPRAVRQYQLDMLHCTSNTAPLRAGVPLIITLHDIIYLEGISLTKGNWYQRLGNVYRRWNVPRVVPRCEQILTVSGFEQQRIMQHFGLPAGQVQVLYNSSGSHFQPMTNPMELAALKKKYRLPDQFLFFLANTDPKKNLLGVLKALALLKAQGHLRLPLVMLDYAEDKLAAMLASIGAPALRADIVLCGHVPNQELPGFYALSSAFLYPSLRESFGIPILEAMACGTPVITSNTSAMPEVAGGAALLIDPLAPQTIADAIQQLATQPELAAELIAKGLARAHCFSWSRSAEQAMRLYERVGQQALAVALPQPSYERPHLRPLSSKPA